MAITIKCIPILRSNDAKNFIRKADSSIKNRATVNFSQQVKTSLAILEKAQMR